MTTRAQENHTVTVSMLKDPEWPRQPSQDFSALLGSFQGQREPLLKSLDLVPSLEAMLIYYAQNTDRGGHLCSLQLLST